MIRPLRVLCLVAVLLLAGAAPAAAHNVTAGADLRFAQTIAGAELTVVIKGTSRVPGPLLIGVIAYEPATGPPIGLEVRSVEDGHKVTGTAQPSATPRYVKLTVERTGPHELRLTAGDQVAVLPFRVLVDRGSAGEFLIYGGLLVAGLLLVGGLLTGALSRRTPAMLLAGGAAAAVTVAAMVVVFEPSLPPPLPDGAAPAVSAPALGRPFARGRVTTVPARPAAGEEFTLRLDLTDGSTGHPVDDLVLHHEALAHLVVTSEDGAYFRHLHPLRTAPGRLEVRLRADRPGRFLAYAELEREDSGGQLLDGEFRVAGHAVAAPPPVPAATGGTPVVRPSVPVAGRPAAIEVALGVTPRQWLGMSGHLIVRSQDGAFLGHVHEMGAPAPRLRFTFSFPAPGRYLAWAQYAAGDRIVTVPFTVEVAEALG
ncbi:MULTISPECIES: hypothetical protein [unclassified Nonomuraea]|uniref:hypothetical protein n=1 Tax=unclassified Nonomuraea TaxID=2593643 RepID=UPI0033C840A7